MDNNKVHPAVIVILVIGVNGTGKTTSIGKMASKFKALGKDVMLVAGDTFRAAAGEQLQIWAERVGADIVSHQPGADPGAVVYDSIRASQSRKADLLIVAVGKPGLIRPRHVKPGAVVIDVEINRAEDGHIFVDVAFDEVAEKASWITPVPGGVGPMTIACLMRNTLDAATRREEGLA